MATTRGWALKGNIIDAISYILDLQNNLVKTENGILVHTSDGGVTPLLDGYRWKREHLNNHNKHVGYHFQFSLPHGEGSADDCLELAKEWIETISNGKAKYVIAVHTNTKNIHAHIICDWFLNDGKQWDIFWKKDRKRFRAAADRICKAHGFSVLEQTQERGQHYFEWLQNNTDSDRESLKKIIDDTIPKVASYDDLKNYLKALGFTVKDTDSEKQESKNTFVFTADIKLIHRDVDGTYLIRIPYQKDLIRVDEENFKWLKPNKTARIILPVDKKINVFNDTHNYKATVTAEDLKRDFEDKKRKERKGLRIIMPHGKKVIRTQFLKDENGNTYSTEDIKKRIKENGIYFTDEKIRHVIENQNDFATVLEAKRDLYERAGIKSEMDSKTIFRSQKQENYFRWKANQVQKRMDRLNYDKLLEKDRSNLELMKERKSELQKELADIHKSLNELEQEINVTIQQRMENTIQISDEELDKAIVESKEPLLTKKAEVKEQIRLYSQRIDNAEHIKTKQQRIQEIVR